MKAVIIDDESNSADVLRMLIDKYCSHVSVAGTAADAESGKKLIHACAPDIVFLDIEMPVDSGFDMLDRMIRKNFHVIFTTAYDHYALRAIKYSALDYLLKPVDIDELQEAVSKAAHRLDTQKPYDFAEIFRQYFKKENASDKVAIPTSEGLQFVEVRTIVRCEATGNYTRVFLLGDRHYLVPRTLKEYEELLASHNFLRVHHAHLINLHHIEKYVKGEGGYVIMADGSVVDISKRKKRDFLSRFSDEF